MKDDKNTIDVDREVLVLFIRKEVNNLREVLIPKPEIIFVVLRFHLLIENLLERIIIAKIERGNRIIDKGYLSFNQKVYLVYSLNVLDIQTIDTIKQLNSIRNHCAHNKDKELTIGDIESIGRPLGRTYTDIKNHHADNLVELTILTFAKIYEKVLVQVAWLEFNDTE